MERAIVFEVRREGYDIEQVSSPVTVGRLKELLEWLDDDLLFICSHDNGYTYGSLPSVADIRESREGEYGTEWDEVDVVYL